MESYCDSDEEVFFGPVTLKEVKKALSLNRRTERHEPMLTTVEADTRGEPAAESKEELTHNLTYTPQMQTRKEKEFWNRMSLDVNAVKLFTDKEASAPPPSPEKMDYNGSPFPTPCNPRKSSCNSLYHITEEDELANRHDRASRQSKLSILTTMNDSLTDDLKEPLPAVQEQFDSSQELSEQEPTEERTKGRNILLEKMKEYESQEQQIKSMKKTSLHKVTLEDSLAELSTDDLLILNDVENDYFSEEISSSPASLCSNTEALGEPTGSVPARKELPRDCISDLRFSRLVSERKNGSYEDEDLAGFSSNFLADCERRYGKHRLDEVLASLSSEEESPQRSTSTSDASPERIRSMSPEYNIDKRSESRCSSHSSAGEVSLSDSVIEISILDEGLSTEVEQLSCGVGNISVVDDPEVSQAAEKNTSGIDTSVRFRGDLLEQADIISEEYQLLSKEGLEQTSPEYNEDCIMTDVTRQASLQTEVSAPDSVREGLEVESISHTTETTAQDCSYSQTSLSNRIHEILSNNQEYSEAKPINDSQKNASVVGDKTFIMSEEYSLISDAESDPYTPNKGDYEYHAEPCVNLASFDEKVAASVDKDGGFLSVLSEAALLHASLAHHSNKLQADSPNLAGEQEAHDQIYESEIKLKHNSSIGVNQSEDAKDMNISSQILDNSMQTDYCAGETNALADLSDTDLEHASFALSADTAKFNDTLEEMEMLLKYGYSYQTSSNVEDCHKSTDEATSESLKPNQLAVEQLELTVGQLELTVEQLEIAVGKEESPNKVTGSEAKRAAKGRSTFETVHNLPDCSLSPVLHSRHGEKSHLPVAKKDASPNSEKRQSPLLNKTRVRTKEFESPFKVPAKPVSQAPIRPGTPRVTKPKPTHTTPASPFKKPGYKKIVSPVGMYIHNTPSPSLVTNVKPITSPRSKTTKTCNAPSTPVSSTVQQHSPEKFKPCSVSKNNAENIDTNNIRPILPMVSYKSGPALKLDAKETEKLPKMNEKMKKLIDTPRPHVIRHEGRVRIEPIPQMKKFASPKRSKCTKNSFNASDPEISVVVEQKAIRTNTVGI